MIEVPENYKGTAYVSPVGGSEVLGLERSTFYRRVMPHVYSGTIESLKIGACRRIRIATM